MKKLLVVGLCLLTHLLRAQDFNRFTKDIETYTQLLKMPAMAIGVAKGDSLIYFKGIGYANPDTKEPVNADHIFVISSLTKGMTSVIMQQMEAERKLRLDDLLNNFPNQYFTKERWDDKTTLAHILSHTSESKPIGTGFVYNGGKYNTVFNAIRSINKIDSANDITRPFTYEVEKRLIEPLNLNHTIAKYNAAKHEKLINSVARLYAYNDSLKAYTNSRLNFPNMQSGPAYGMMSSVRDLVKYSAALDKGTIISKERYKTITTPFYKGSPQGMGWFTSKINGLDIHWAYGYGADASILLKIPSRNLTFVMLSSTDMASATTRLGFGNPFNAPLVCAFLKTFVLNKKEGISFNKDITAIENQIKTLPSKFNFEELFAYATVMSFAPQSLTDGYPSSDELLKLLIKYYPFNAQWDTPTAYEIIAKSKDKTIQSFGKDLALKYWSSLQQHPGKSFYSGVILEKSELTKVEGMIKFKILSDYDNYQEQGYKFDAMMKLAKYYLPTDPTLAKKYLSWLMKYKEYIDRRDRQYNEAKELLEKN
ncbi:serine hydrolase [Emticicia sp. BO119]|uniref:serine hydrolase domain-containing protein n=1 Tax=Emticicia sp. BO119 TaxID=2757768 RepID=UPI0015F10309|nr:serine hydrolase domain-containing protein [Emticicia sp. BO119]MBA4850611.1 beta-lactamase family protein [Emticicia sp. BO119]